MTIDDFKFRMGYRTLLVKQCVVFHPLVLPLVNRCTLRILQGLQGRYSSSPWLAKAEDLARFSIEGKTLSNDQNKPKILKMYNN